MVEAQTAIGFTSMTALSAALLSNPFPRHHQQQHFTCFSTHHHLPFSRTSISVSEKLSRTPPKPFKFSASLISSSTSSSCFGKEIVNGNFAENVEKKMGSSFTSRAEEWRRKRVFLLDVNPLCYDGNVPSLHSFARWISLFFSQVSLSDPVIAVSYLYSVPSDPNIFFCIIWTESLHCRCLMVKKAMSTAENCYLHIKQIEGN